MIPVELLSLEEEIGNDAEDDKRDDLLNDFQLHQREWPAIADKAYPVGWYLTAVLEEGDCPREKNDTEQWPVG